MINGSYNSHPTPKRFMVARRHGARSLSRFRIGRGGSQGIAHVAAIYRHDVARNDKVDGIDPILGDVRNPRVKPLAPR